MGISGRSLDFLMGIRRLVTTWLPSRQVILRVDGRLSVFRLGTTTQLLAVGALAGLVVWGTAATWGFVSTHYRLDDSRRDVAKVQIAYQALQRDVGAYQRRFTDITRDLEDNHAKALALVEQNAALERNLKTVQSELESSKRQQMALLETRQALKAQMADLEQKMRGTSSRNFVLKDDLNSTESLLEAAHAARDEARVESHHLRARITTLENRLAEAQTDHVATVRRMVAQADSRIEALSEVITLTGLSVKEVMDEVGAAGQGGPFVAADGIAGKNVAELAHLDTRVGQWQALRDVVGQLPLAAPLDGYYITSSFGKRRDPLNGKWAMHYGVDLGTTPKAPVRATAAGTVTIAGWKGRYGRLVEIDHGAGVKTRFGHLAKIFVKQGQVVAFRDKIGLVGNSGRSTGRHLHYEVIFRGKSRNPMRFIKAGQYVFKN